MRGSWECLETWRDKALVHGEVALPFIATQRRGTSGDHVSVAEKEGGHIVQIDRHHANLRLRARVQNEEGGVAPHQRTRIPVGFGNAMRRPVAMRRVRGYQRNQITSYVV